MQDTIFRCSAEEWQRPSKVKGKKIRREGVGAYLVTGYEQARQVTAFSTLFLNSFAQPLTLVDDMSLIFVARCLPCLPRSLYGNSY
jgi:hypothetical protein